MFDVWDARFEQLKRFKEQRGHCRVPEKYPGGLGAWAKEQRRRDKEGSPRVGAERAQRLEELGFRWEAAKGRSWEERFRQLQEFQEEHGHCNVPQKHPGGLGVWAANQRCKGKEWSQRRNAKQVQQLDDLGFRWDTAKKLSWEERFRQLKEFKEEHGHCNVPQKHPGGLGIWVANQRRGGKQVAQRRNAERTQKLEELGFRWATASDRREARAVKTFAKFVAKKKTNNSNSTVPASLITLATAAEDNANSTIPSSRITQGGNEQIAACKRSKEAVSEVKDALEGQVANGANVTAASLRIREALRVREAAKPSARLTGALVAAQGRQIRDEMLARHETAPFLTEGEVRGMRDFVGSIHWGKAVLHKLGWEANESGDAD